jgi:tRNA modification GTPase
MASSFAELADTIVAIATPVGRGALAVIRMSGPDAFAIARKHVRPWPAKSRLAQLSLIHDGNRALDRSLVTVFDHPDSFTGEDTVEISTHGGHIVPASVISALISSGARKASPGEFTRRAVLNGKLDVLQAEAVGDLIDAESYAMQHVALDHLDGGLSRRLLDLRSDVIGLEALIAYDIDFPEEDDGPVPRERVARAAGDVRSSIEALLATAPVGEVVREGAVVVIAGPPNAGKSSLFNAILGKSRAIVTDIPGTTRDALEAVIDTGTYPLRLVDTAGLRNSEDTIERLGIEVSERYLAGAHVVLACAESNEALETTAALVAVKSAAPVVKVRTKSDLVSQCAQTSEDGVVLVSAKTGIGLTRLLDAVNAAVSDKYGNVPADLPVITRARHLEALRSALEEVTRFQSAWLAERLPAPIAAVHLRAAVISLEELVGAVDLEDVFDRVFSSFCVGK